MLKEYKIKVHIEGHYTIEDPKCPSYWMGSGCYDIEIPTWCDTELDVWAESEEQATRIVYEYEFVDRETIIEFDAVQVESVKFVADLEGRDKEEAGVIEPVIYNWKENQKDW